ncbi:MAG: hypothetical protein ABI172_02710 [Ginsengibacter sp.]
METNSENHGIMQDLQEYSIVKSTANDAELQKVKEIFSLHGFDRNLEGLQWVHQQNLYHTNILFFAIHKKTNEVAAILGAIPVNMVYKDQVILSIQLIDALTHSNHRYKKLFYTLVYNVEKDSKALNYQLVYGIPNEEALHNYIHKLAFTYFGEVPFLIKPMGISYVVKKFFKRGAPIEPQEINCKIDATKELSFKNNTSIKFISRFQEDYDKLWAKVVQKITIGINRDAAYMNWRYVEKPGEDYSRYGFYENGVLEGIVIFALKNKHGGKIGYLMEILFNPENEAAGNKLLKFCSKVLKMNKADLILAWCFPHSFNYFCHRKAGFFKFPEKIRPQKLGIIVKSLNIVPAENIYNIKDWFFSYSDSDTV